MSAALEAARALTAVLAHADGEEAGCADGGQAGAAKALMRSARRLVKEHVAHAADEGRWGTGLPQLARVHVCAGTGQDVEKPICFQGGIQKRASYVRTLVVLVAALDLVRNSSTRTTRELFYNFKELSPLACVQALLPDATVLSDLRLTHMVRAAFYGSNPPAASVMAPHQQMRLFKSPDVVATSVANVTALMGVRRSDLNVCTASKGSFAGSLVVMDVHGSIHDGRATGKGGLPIPGDTFEISHMHIQCASAFVIVVEKDAVFQQLVEERIWNKIDGGCVVVTARGMPDLATRAFCVHLRTEIASCMAELAVSLGYPSWGDINESRFVNAVRFLGLVDWNPSGLVIAFTYKYGGGLRAGAEAPDTKKARGTTDGNDDSDAFSSLATEMGGLTLNDKTMLNVNQPNPTTPTPPSTSPPASSAAELPAISNTVSSATTLAAGPRTQTADDENDDSDSTSAQEKRKENVRRKKPITLLALIQSGVVKPGVGALTMTSRGQTCAAELEESGRIRFQGQSFASPSAFAMHVRQLHNPAGCSAGSGWKSVKHNGVLLDVLRAMLDVNQPNPTTPTPPSPSPPASSAAELPAISNTVSSATTLAAGPRTQTADDENDDSDSTSAQEKRKENVGVNVPPAPSKATRHITLLALIQSGVVKPGVGALTMRSGGQTYAAELEESGRIRFQGQSFEWPSAFALHVRRLHNPAKRSQCGWDNIWHNGVRLDVLKAMLNVNQPNPTTPTPPSPSPPASSAAELPAISNTVSSATTLAAGPRTQTADDENDDSDSTSAQKKRRRAMLGKGTITAEAAEYALGSSFQLLGLRACHLADLLASAAGTAARAASLVAPSHAAKAAEEVLTSGIALQELTAKDHALLDAMINHNYMLAEDENAAILEEAMTMHASKSKAELEVVGAKLGAFVVHCVQHCGCL